MFHRLMGRLPLWVANVRSLGEKCITGWEDQIRFESIMEEMRVINAQLQ